MAPSKKRRIPNRNVRERTGHVTPSGSTQVTSELLGPRAIRLRKEQTRRNLESQHLGGTSHFANQLEGRSADWDDVGRMEGVMAGTEPFDISHAGDFQDVLNNMAEDDEDDAEKDAEPGDVMNDLTAGIREFTVKRRRVDNRTRRDRVERRTAGFARQMDAIVEAYLQWCLASTSEEGLAADATLPGGTPDGGYRLTVVDMYTSKSKVVNSYEDEKFIASSLMRQGIVVCSPTTPTVGISIRVLESFRILHLRCSQLAIQKFVRSLCDLHGVNYKTYLYEQFSICYDLYLATLHRVSKQVQVALGRDDPDYRLRNACPACTYKLVGEDKLIFDMLFTMDGNDSLKRVLRREKPPEDEGDGEVKLGESKERVDKRDGTGGYFLTREKVNTWAKHMLALALEEGMGEQVDEEDEVWEDGDNPCAARWKNMINEVTAKMWGIFDESGVFVALCRHGFVLLVVDMVKSGELAKYPLAVVEKLLEVLGADLGGGYDIGCKFATTLGNSPLGPRSRELNYTSLVGLFHGHAHNRLCQTAKLGTYVDGMGIEDLEGCERLFARSNSLAACTRYASVFHRHQAISTYMHHLDRFDTYQSLSSFLSNNYEQALGILKTQEALDEAMRLKNMDPAAVDGWVKEEQDYLKGLKQEPEGETLEMEYYKRLVQSEETAARLITTRDKWMNRDASNINDRDNTNRIETARYAAIENHERLMTTIQDLEQRLAVARRWEPGCPEWNKASELVRKRSYQRALDVLESLIVARMFELTKMNMSQTGYKLRKHIGKALQSRSQAIRTALERYNTAAKLLYPSRKALKWEQVVEYAFLADFDLLREGREDISLRPWADASGRLLMDQHFKLKRAREEIQRLNIEIPRVITYMRDEEAFIIEMEEKTSATDPALALQIRRYGAERSRFTASHMKRFFALSVTPGFSGSILPGTRVQAPLEPPSRESEAEALMGVGHGDERGGPDDDDVMVAVEDDDDDDDDDDEGEGEDEEEALGVRMTAIMGITRDLEHIAIF